MTTDAFTEHVQFFQTENNQIKIGFSLHAGIYSISKSNVHFEEIMANIVKAWHQDKKVAIELKGNEVISAKL